MLFSLDGVTTKSLACVSIGACSNVVNYHKNVETETVEPALNVWTEETEWP